MHKIRHHINGIRMVLNMMPRLGLRIPEELLENELPKMDVNSSAFNLHQEMLFFERLIELMDDPFLGLKLGKVYHLESYGLYGLSILVAPDLRNVFNFVARFSRLSYSLMNFSFETRGKTAYYRMTPSNLKLPEVLRRFYADRDLSASAFAFEDVYRQPIPYKEIGLSHDGQGQQQAYEEYFQCKVRFNQSSCYCALPVELIDKPLPLGQSSTFEICKSLCETELSRLAKDDDIVGLVKQELAVRPGYLQDAPSIAAQLNLSERSLRRKLEKAGTSYQRLQQEIRFKKAQDYLLNTSLKLQEIAELLGYNDAATFCSAFKSWSGNLPPRQYAKQVRRGQIS